MLAAPLSRWVAPVPTELDDVLHTWLCYLCLLKPPPERDIPKLKEDGASQV